MRKTPALLSTIAVAAVVIASLAGCSSSATAGCTPEYSAGHASTLVKATATTASFPTPLVTKTSQVSVNKSGTGNPIQNGDQVDYTFDIYNGATGEKIGTATDPVRAGAVTTATSTSIVKALVCATPGRSLPAISAVHFSTSR